MSSGDKTSNEIVFFGGGPVAEASLKHLQKHFIIEAVVTKPTTLKAMSAITKSPLHQTANKSALSELIATRPFKSRLGVIVDFGVIVEQAVIDSFKLGIVNSHFSLLPRWRGADPISFTILHGDKKTGVSLMLIDASLDTGRLLKQQGLDVQADTTTPELTDKLVELSNKLLVETLPNYISGNIKPRNQPHPERATYSRKLTKADGIIDWNKPAKIIEQEVRAFYGWPGSRTSLAGKDVLITKVHVVNQSGDAGNIQATKKELVIACGQESLSVDKLKPAGKNEMPVAAFLAGHRSRL